MTTHRPLEGRVAFVTGATSGLGERYAVILAEAGARVVISGRRQERLAALADEIAANGGTAVPLVLDVTDPAAVQAAVAEAEARVGPLWLLVNNLVLKFLAFTLCRKMVKEFPAQHYAMP